MAKETLQVKNLQVSFRTQGGILKAVRDVNFDLHQGETLAIVGESGSGKSVTSKAIIGILSGNSIVEGGEILFDGQDLLKISEDDFHKIRGDKIAMIFQDPLSSLNPIMRVGQQLTEAMILNGKARQKNSRTEFNSHLELLRQNLNEINGKEDENKEMCGKFDSFCITSTNLEKEYNDANAEAVALKTNIEETVFLLEHKQKLDAKGFLSRVSKFLKKTVHPYVVTNDTEYETLQLRLTTCIKEGSRSDTAGVCSILNDVVTLLDKSIKKVAPNYFRLGFYVMENPEFDYTTMDVKKLDEMTLKYLNDKFLNDFIALGQTGLEHSHNVSLEKKKNLINKIKEFRTYSENTLSESITKHEAKVLGKRLRNISKGILNAIDYLEIEKQSVEYSFQTSINHEYERFFEGLSRNPVNTKKYNKSKVKYNKLIEQGKTPTWKVIPPYLVDLELTKSNFLKIIDGIIARYEEDLADKSFDPHQKMINLIDFFKEQASRLVYRVTKGIAKTKALELLKEVGIPEPSLRFKQYPFEFSGGMRQRIVIAIALSANPDILICDEPTTALDVTIQSQILELINKIKEERKLSVIFITHDLGVVANMADRIAVMYAGKIVEYGTSDDIFYNPRHPYTWALLSSMPDLETKEKLEAIPGTPPNMIYPPVGDAFAERNKYAMEIDFEQQPPLFEVSPTHYAATWLLHPSAPKVEPPKIIRERIERMKKEAKKL